MFDYVTAMTIAFGVGVPAAIVGYERAKRALLQPTPPAAAASALARHGAAKRRAKVLRVMNALRAEMGMAPFVQGAGK